MTTKIEVLRALYDLNFRSEPAEPNYLTGKDLKARVLFVNDNGIELQLSQRSTFDRWANSTNFIATIDEDSDIKRIVQQARKICRSKVFNFNTYFHAIDLT